MSELSRLRIQTILIFALCSLLTADIVLRVFDGNPAEATRISGRETDAAIDRLAGTYNQMAAANNALSASINRLTGQLARLQLDKWADAEEELARSQEVLAAAATNLALSIAESEVATDSGDVPVPEESSDIAEQGENGQAIEVKVKGE